MAGRAPRHLIVNADDFGQTPGINRGIIEAHEHGIVSSASLMVRWPAAPEGAAYARRHRDLSLGLHVDFEEWMFRRGRWQSVYQVVPSNDLRAVRRALTSQLDRFRRLVDCNPTHIDSHQHVHLQKRLRPLFLEFASRLNVPLRRCSRAVRYCGDFYGQDSHGRPCPSLIRPAALQRVLERLRPGITELGCHPGYGQGLKSMYRRERALEVKALCDPKIRTTVRRYGIVLRSFHDLGDAPRT